MIQIPLQTSSNAYFTAEQLQFYALTKGHIECAAAIRRSIPSWTDETYKRLVFNCASQNDAKLIREQVDIVKLFAKLRGLVAVLLSFPKAKANGKVIWTLSAAKEGDDLVVIPPVPSNVSEIDLIRVINRMREAEEEGIRQSLVHNETDWQLFVTKPLANLLEMSVSEASNLNMRTNWIHDGVDDGLAEMKRLLKQQEVVQQSSYRTQLKPGYTYDFVSRFELVLDGQFRLTTNFSAFPVGSRV